MSSSIRINQGRSRRGLRDDPLQIFVVDPNGRIKHVNYDVNVSSPLLQLERAGESGSTIVSVRLSSWAEDRGYKFLIDHYKDENNERGFKQYESYAEAAARGDLGREHVDGRIQKDGEWTDLGWDIAQQFPEDLLPKAVLELRKKPQRGGAGWTPLELEEPKKRGRGAAEA